MKNKNNITRQIYRALLGNNELDAAKIINYRDIRPVVQSATPVRLLSGNGSIFSLPMNYAFTNPKGTHFLDLARIRMFMFRYYRGNIKWNELFWGNGTQ